MHPTLYDAIRHNYKTREAKLKPSSYVVPKIYQLDLPLLLSKQPYSSHHNRIFHKKYESFDAERKISLPKHSHILLDNIQEYIKPARKQEEKKTKPFHSLFNNEKLHSQIRIPTPYLSPCKEADTYSNKGCNKSFDSNENNVMIGQLNCKNIPISQHSFNCNHVFRNKPKYRAYSRK